MDITQKINQLFLEKEHPDEIDSWEQLPKDVAQTLILAFGSDIKNKVKSFQVVKEAHAGVEDFPVGVRVWFDNTKFHETIDVITLKTFLKNPKFEEFQIGRQNIAFYFKSEE